MTARRFGALLAGGAAALSLLALPPAPVQATPTAATPTAAPAAPGSSSDGGWRVTDGRGGVEVTYRLAEPLPVTGARPQVSLDGEPLGPALVSPDGRTLTLLATLDDAPDAADLDVTLSGRPLDGPASPAPVGGAVPDPPTPGPLLDVDPAAPGDFDVATDDYDLSAEGGAPADGLPNVETVGHVEGPVDAGAAPVVLFLHGRHEFCYVDRTTSGGFRWPCRPGEKPIPSQLGYTYVQEVLASQGFVTVSIAANGINAQDGELDDGGAQARAELIEHHLDLLADGSLDEYLPDGTTPDLDQVVLVGHSRGGEGVNRATESDPPGGPYEVVGQVLLAPTDFALQATPYVPSVTVLPYCDGDVSDLQGQLYTDVPRDLTLDDPALHSSVLVMGANHNYFNTEWTPRLSAAPSSDDAGYYNRGYCADDRRASDPRLEPQQQQDVGLAYIAGAARLFTGETDLAPLFDGTQARAATTQDLDIRSHATGTLRDVVRPGIGSEPSDGSATAALCDGSYEDCVGEARYGSPHFPFAYFPGFPTRAALRVDWTAAGQTAGLTLDDPIDLSGDAFLDLRVLLPPLDVDAAFDVVLTDATGDSKRLTPLDGGRVPALPSRQYGAAAVAQTLRAELDVPGMVDLSQVTAVDVVSLSDSGTAWLIDAAGVAADLPDPGSAHAPALDLEGEVSVEEGDGPGSVDIAYTLDAPAPAGAQVRIVPVSFEDSNPLGDEPVDVDVPAGSTEGTISLPFEGDDVYGGRQRVLVLAFPLRGVAPADSLSRVRIVDDEPAPVVTLQARPRVVREGGTVVFRGTSDQAFGSRQYFIGFLVRGPGPVLRVGDLGRRYLRRYGLTERDPRDPAIGQDFPLMGRAPKGATTFDLRLPIRADGVAEGRERVTVRIGRFTPIAPARATAVVRDRAGR